MDGYLVVKGQNRFKKQKQVEIFGISTCFLTYKRNCNPTRSKIF